MEGFEFTLPPDLSALGLLRSALDVWLQSLQLRDQARFDLVLATHEAAANAIEHSAAGEPVAVSARLVDGCVAVEVTNRGAWKPHGDPTETRGRGIALIQDLMSELEIELSDAGTRVRLVARI